MTTLPKCKIPNRLGGRALRAHCCGYGFTLIELLVVLAILGFIVALVLPAIQAARESARRSQCQIRLRQVGTSALLFESVFGHLPPGYLGPVPPRNVISRNVVSERDHQLMGLVPYLLPYLEYGNVFSQIGEDMLDVRNEPSFQLWVLNQDTWEAANNTIELLVCPSATRAPPSVGVLLFLNGYRKGNDLILQAAPSPPEFSAGLGTTNYLGNSGFFGKIGVVAVDNWRGPFTTRSQTRITDIRDGTSSTLMLGEAVGAVADGELTFAHSWMGCGSMPLIFGIGDVKAWYTFNSEHPGHVAFCFADGSVRFLDVSISQDVLEKMGGIADGQIF